MAAALAMPMGWTTRPIAAALTASALAIATGAMTSSVTRERRSRRIGNPR
jgi:hypothetical protein